MTALITIQARGWRNRISMAWRVLCGQPTLMWAEIDVDDRIEAQRVERFNAEAN